MNARVLIIFSLVALLFGVSYYNQDSIISEIVIVSSLVAILTQMLFALAYKAPLNSVLSAIITALLINLIVRTNYVFVYCLATHFAIASKFLIQNNKRQFINPTIFGLTSIFFLIGNSDFKIPEIPFYFTLIFIVFNILVLGYNKILNVHSFLTYHILILPFLFMYSKVEMVEVQNILIMSSFFLLDRSSLPNSSKSKIIIGALIFIFQIFFYQYFSIEISLILSVFLASLLSPVFNYFFKNSSFYWNGTNIRVLNEG